MTAAFRGLPLLLILSILWPPLALAQTPPLTWGAVPGAGGYLVEVRTKASRTVASQTVTQPSFTLELVPGDYELRITTLNKFLKPETSSAWAPFSVRRAVVPTLTGVTPGVLKEGETSPLVVRGTGLSSATEVRLLAGDDEVKVSGLRVLSAQELEFSAAGPLKPGSYTVVLRNPPGQTARLPGGLTVVPRPAPVVVELPPPVPQPVVAPLPAPLPPPVKPSVPLPLPSVPEVLPPGPPAQILASTPVKVHFSLGGGYGVLLPLHPWGELIGPSYRNVEAFALVPLVGKMGPLVQLSYVGFDSQKGTDFVDSHLNAGDLALGGYWELDSPLPLRFWAAPGVTVTQASLGGADASSFDPSLTAGASLVFRPAGIWFWELAFQYEVYFYTGTPLQNLGFNLRTGVDF